MLGSPAAAIVEHAGSRDPVIVPVILSGGSGSRLWPVSRASFPKQLWPLISDRTMLQETALRGVGPAFRAAGGGGAPGAPLPDRRAVARGRDRGGQDRAGTGLGRNSAPALAAAALLVAETAPDAVLWMMAADSAITRAGRAGRVGGAGGPRRRAAAGWSRSA